MSRSTRSATTRAAATAPKAAAAAAAAPTAATAAPTAAVGPSLPLTVDQQKARNAFWTTLWHVDIFKDHKEIKESVVNRFLPNDGKYEATVSQTWDEGVSKVVISENDKYGNRGIKTGYTNTADTLFNFLIPELGKELPFKLANGTEFIDWSCAALQSPSTAKPNTMVTDLAVNTQISNSKYDIKVFAYRDEHKKTTIDVVKLKEFMGDHKLLLTVDTSVDLPSVIENYPGDLIYAYTREIENDAASKINFESSKNVDFQRKYFTEKVTSERGLNPTVITYPPYTENDPMSYFYCKYPVCLKCEGAGPVKKKTLRTSLFYMKGTKTIIIPDGANKAKGFEKAKEKLLSAFGFGAKSDDMLESVYISKHHGDIAQTMVKNRDIVLTPASGGSDVHSQDYKNVFVSIDMNACSKAFTLDADFVWMYTADKTRLVVWKNQRLLNPESIKQAKRQQYSSMYDKLVKDIELYNEHVDRIQREKIEFDKFVVLFTAIPSADTTPKDLKDLVTKYIDHIKKGIQIAILSTFIPTEERKRIESWPKKENVDGKNTDAVIELIKKLEEERGNLNLSSDFEEIKFFNIVKNEPMGVSVEKTLLFIKKGETITGKKLDNIWASINLEYKPGDKTFGENLLCRNGTRFNSSWGLDIILSIYQRLALYNKEYSKSYIHSLYNLFNSIPEKQHNFFIGLDILGLTEGIERPKSSSGGTRKRRTLRGGAVTTSTQTSLVRPSTLPSTVRHITLRARTYKDDFNLAVDDMLSDMYEHLLFLNKIRYETSYVKFLEAFDHCMLNIYGIRMPTELLRTLHYKNPTKQIGGDDEEEVALEDIQKQLNGTGTAAAEATAAAAAGRPAAAASTPSPAVGQKRPRPTTAAAGAGATAAAGAGATAAAGAGAEAAAGAGATAAAGAGAEAAAGAGAEADVPPLIVGDEFETLYSEYEQYVHIVEHMTARVLTRAATVRLNAIQELLDTLNAEEKETFEYKKKSRYGEKTVKIDKDGTVSEEYVEPAAKRTCGGFRRRTYKKKRM